MSLTEPSRAAVADLETVTAVTHFGERNFSFRVTRPRSLRFRSGEFVMIGLPDIDGKPLLRAYSISSPSWDDELEFYSIKVPGGALTSRLQQIAVGDRIIVRPKAVGTLVLDGLTPARRLWMICSGTGIAPFCSLLRDPETWERYEDVVVAHTCRTNDELAYGRLVMDALPEDPLIGELCAGRLHYYPTTTREESPCMGRITDHIRSGEIFSKLDRPTWTKEVDRVMICGSMELNLDLMQICRSCGLEEGSNSRPGDFVVEKAFVGEGS
ncbi:ferredoxin--NADP reductase [Microvirga arsenatis]|uniref:ferredoxin--NADP(+) reductase n=1 Tax=Microvirga arsenatis TaxID=2692265 RepID=A0ABW9YZW8_9HYPH|nr:ferredoxin--NADP reductase [Microvirga arsenatis]NBJ11847.1 ferredoxin--NADP reductase [Microvirga arsenatis]NBJ23959.1 ferredoxin--NADP reductase [Microvirga arsenatis]